MWEETECGETGIVGDHSRFTPCSCLAAFALSGALSVCTFSFSNESKLQTLCFFNISAVENKNLLLLDHGRVTKFSKFSVETILLSKPLSVMQFSQFSSNCVRYCVISFHLASGTCVLPLDQAPRSLCLGWCQVGWLLRPY